MIHWLVRHRLVASLIALLIIVGGLHVSPFAWNLSFPQNPVAVDALPDLGENQQIVFTEWAGRSPQDVEEQVSYPLSAALMGVPGVRDVRSVSMFGFSTISVIFEENIEFYWSRTRILEKLSSLPANTLPSGVQPTLGPDATGLGQVFWYTLEGRDRQGNPVGGWDLDEIRSVQDWYVRYALLQAPGVSEVASIGGYVREYQIDIDPRALREHNISLAQVESAISNSNVEVGAGNLELNSVDYLVRGVGFVESLSDIEQAVVAVNPDYRAIRMQDLATVSLGPARRRGALDVGGAEAVGGVVTVREGANPFHVISEVKSAIERAAPSLPSRAIVQWQHTRPTEVNAFALENNLPWFPGSHAEAENSQATEKAWSDWLQAHPPRVWPDWLQESQLTIVPYYDRSGLIQETLGTLELALSQQLLITAAVLLVLLLNARSAIAVGATLPLAVLLTLMAMKLIGVEANIVALAGIAIAIGTIVDMAIIVTENVFRHLRERPNDERTEVVSRATREVAPAVVTAIITTVISFLPVFVLTGAEGKLFSPLAYTKTLVLLASVFVALVILPAALRYLLNPKFDRIENLKAQYPWGYRSLYAIAVVYLLTVLARWWQPVGIEAGDLRNFTFVAVVFALIIAGFWAFLRVYPHLLRWCLRFKAVFLVLPTMLVVWAVSLYPSFQHSLMPALDEGAFLLMPTTMPHASIGEALDILSEQDKRIAAIPEVEHVVGKIGRAETALDPAPISMLETYIAYLPEFRVDEQGRRLRFKVDAAGEFVRDQNNELVPDNSGKPYRQWREHIRSPDDIWDEIVQAASLPGVTSAPKLQPIETRQVMLQTGMRARMGVRVQADTLENLAQAVNQIESQLREVELIRTDSVNAERIIGQPYLEIHLERNQLQRYGISMAEVQRVIATAIGGMEVSTSIEGRERYALRVRYQREQRNELEAMQEIWLSAPTGALIPLSEVARIEYRSGPQMIRTENSFLTSYVTFGGIRGSNDLAVVEAAKSALNVAQADGEMRLPAGVQYEFAGSYEQQQRAMQTLQWIIPLALVLILIVLYVQFKQLSTALFIFSGVAVAWAGGFLLLAAYGQTWFGNFTLPWITDGQTLRDIFNMQSLDLSVAVWVGFLALFGIAVDDGVVMSTYIQQQIQQHMPNDRSEVRALIIDAVMKRVRPCLLTSATTILALLPVLSATGSGADLMVPLAIPTVGGLSLVLLSMFIVPVLWSWREERRV
ncbi:MAG: RND-type copper/silver efflux system permease component CusA [Idiomarinaceae bacterium HL-53]|nr:MAG: RND-type copper/silver efflux system permease component CusA [Idiomarinaceae bacterium HL-53]CUS47341.1 AcrB/AcrD/AcrF family protein [Idiomarinaceae bacterium HL-53]